MCQKEQVLGDNILGRGLHQVYVAFLMCSTVQLPGLR